ncbi:hypothetical protein [Alkalihalobacillus sp. AL-G]|uniref:hypothetical protein n=1 Tax=Alkalihalobacillus sp. AL-G TaxID=2926399 RepID=UPI00272CA2F0|nr:hypothetical protein [Alkalihalobacillus sp. AL-G]WLD94965.1 glycosyltransferase [Alkalihalobacillus sp. AL-G]
MIFCTSICLDQLAQTKVLSKSLKQNIPGSKLIICLVEEDFPSELKSDQDFDEIVLRKNIKIENFKQKIHKYNQYEVACASKAPLLTYVYNKYISERFFIYIDPDIQVFSSLPEVEQSFKTNSIIFTPHFLSPPALHHNIWEENAEIEILRVGVFNGGFIGIKRSGITEQFLNWWNQRSKQDAYIDSVTGFYTDQRWLTSALVLFDGIKILKHYGYNIAIWNLNERRITSKNNHYFANGEPFRFFNFSHVNLLAEKSNKDSVMYRIVNTYLEELNEYRKLFPQRENRRYHQNHTRKRRSR